MHSGEDVDVPAARLSGASINKIVCHIFILAIGGDFVGISNG